MSNFIVKNLVTRGWVDLYDEFGFSYDTQLVVHNPNSQFLVISTGSDPDLDENWIRVPPNQQALVAKKNPYAWVKCDGYVSVGDQQTVEVSPTFNYVGLAGNILSSDANSGKRLKTTSYISDRQGKTAKISLKGEQIVGMMIDDVDVNFQYGLRPAKVETEVTGTGTAGTYKSTAELSAGTGVGSSQIASLEPVRYRGGHESYTELSLIFGEPEANLNQYGGFLDDVDRLCVGYQGVTFGILFTEGGNETFVPMSDVTIDPLDGTGPSGFTINPQAINVYRLSFVWHGGLPLTLEVQYNQQWWPVHTFDFSNQIDETHLENPHLPVGMLIERLSGSGADVKFRSGSWRGGSISASGDETLYYWTSHTILDAALVNDRNNIYTIVNPLTWKGKNNHIVYELGVLALDSSANKSAAVYGTFDATIAGGGTQTPIDSDNTPLEYINGGTLTGGTKGPATVIKGGSDRQSDLLGTGVRLYPGHQISIEVDPGGAVNGTFSVSTRWRGEH